MPIEPPVTSPSDLWDAYEALAVGSSAQPVRPIAGGTDLMVALTGEIGDPPSTLVDLWAIDALRGIAIQGDALSLGALTTYTEIRDSAVLARRYPMLPMAASETGGLATQNRGTIGGNIANASPAADTPPALLVYDVELELMSAAGTRRVPYATFH